MDHLDSRRDFQAQFLAPELNPFYFKVRKKKFLLIKQFSSKAPKKKAVLESGCAYLNDIPKRRVYRRGAHCDRLRCNQCGDSAAHRARR